MASPSPELLASILSGKQFLLATQDEDGMWRDYCLTPGASEAWTTSVISFSIANPPLINNSAHALRKAADALHRVRTPSGWNYNILTAPDADSTAWTLRFLALLDDLRGLDATALLGRFLGESSAARTFLDPIRFGAWAEEHADVTPVVGLALLDCGADPALIRRLRHACLACRNRKGLWKAFWWITDSYAIGRNIEFLAASGGIPKDVREAVRRWFSSKTGPLSAFEAAQDLMIVAILSLRMEPCMRILLDQQHGDGSWPPSPVLFVPPQQPEASGPGAIHADSRGLMTTAMAVVALSRSLLLLERPFS